MKKGIKNKKPKKNLRQKILVEKKLKKPKNKKLAAKNYSHKINKKKA